MRRLCRTLACILFLLANASFFSEAPGLKKLSIKKGEFRINNVLVSGDWKMKNVWAALGPEPVLHNYSSCTYTHSGVLVYKLKSDTSLLTEFQVFFSEPERESGGNPSHLFTGPAKIDKLVVSKNLVPAAVRSGLKGWKNDKCNVKHHIRMSQNGIYVFFVFNTAETALEKICVGPDKK